MGSQKHWVFIDYLKSVAKNLAEFLEKESQSFTFHHEQFSQHNWTYHELIHYIESLDEQRHLFSITLDSDQQEALNYVKAIIRIKRQKEAFLSDNFFEIKFDKSVDLNFQQMQRLYSKYGISDLRQSIGTQRARHFLIHHASNTLSDIKFDLEYLQWCEVNENDGSHDFILK